MGEEESDVEEEASERATFVNTLYAGGKTTSCDNHHYELATTTTDTNEASMLPTSLYELGSSDAASNFNDSYDNVESFLMAVNDNVTSLSAASIGSRVTIDGYDCAGTLRFYGRHHTKNSLRCGVDLDEPIGNNNGTVDVSFKKIPMDNRLRAINTLNVENYTAFLLFPLRSH